MVRSKDKNQEYLLCSAIYYDDGEVHEDTRGLPRNKTTGFYIAGWRHHNCYGMLFTTIPRDRIVLEYCEEGFLTSKGNFLDREESKKLALEIGQVTEESMIATVLTSEDLWG